MPRAYGSTMYMRALLIAAAGAFLLLVAARPARAGTYTVLECHHAAPQNESHEAAALSAPSSGGPYAVQSGGGICANAAAEYAIGIHPFEQAYDGEYGSVHFDAPDGTKFTGVALDARLRSEQGHRARLSMTNAAGVEQARFAVGSTGPQHFTRYTWPASGHPAYPRFAASLVCDNAPYNCPISGTGANAETAIRNIRFELDDSVAPVVELSGSLCSTAGRAGPVVSRRAGVGSRLRCAPISGDAQRRRRCWAALRPPVSLRRGKQRLRALPRAR